MKLYFSKCGIIAKGARTISASDRAVAIRLLASKELSFAVEGFEWNVESERMTWELVESSMVGMKLVEGEMKVENNCQWVYGG